MQIKLQLLELGLQLLELHAAGSIGCRVRPYGLDRQDCGSETDRIEGVTNRIEGVTDRIEGVTDRIEGVTDRIEGVKSRKREKDKIK